MDPLKKSEARAPGRGQMELPGKAVHPGPWKAMKVQLVRVLPWDGFQIAGPGTKSEAAGKKPPPPPGRRPGKPVARQVTVARQAKQPVGGSAIPGAGRAAELQMQMLVALGPTVPPGHSLEKDQPSLKRLKLDRDHLLPPVAESRLWHGPEWGTMSPESSLESASQNQTAK